MAGHPFKGIKNLIVYYVYILKSINFPEKVYVGYTNDLDNRLSVHNQGKSKYTSKYKPWILHSYITFKEKEKAIHFEKYLKSGSGKSLIKKHF